jgi:hypothetical protein
VKGDDDISRGAPLETLPNRKETASGYVPHLSPQKKANFRTTHVVLIIVRLKPIESGRK